VSPRDLLRPAGFLAAFGSALIHLAIAPEHLAEAPWIGWSFLLAFCLLGATAVTVLTDDSAVGWHAGALVCAGMVAALLLSRTTGLPGGYREGWEPAAVWSLGLELAFLGCYAARSTGTRGRRWKEVAPDADAGQALAGGTPAARPGDGGPGRPAGPRQLAVELSRPGVPPAAHDHRPAAPQGDP